MVATNWLLFYIDYSFKKLLLTIVFLTLLFYLSFYWEFKVFLEEFDNIRLFWGVFFIKYLENGLEIFKVKGSVLYFFLLKLRGLFDFTLSCTNKCSRVTKIFLKKYSIQDKVPTYSQYLCQCQ